MKEQETLICLYSDSKLKLIFQQDTIATFCLRVKNKYPVLTKKDFTKFCNHLCRLTYVKMDFLLSLNKMCEWLYLQSLRGLTNLILKDMRASIELNVIV